MSQEKHYNYVEGVLTEIADQENIGANFQKVDAVVDVESGKYINQVKFQFVNMNIRLLDLHKVGDRVRVYFDIRSRSGQNNNGQDFLINNLIAWRIESCS